MLLGVGICAAAFVVWSLGRRVTSVRATVRTVIVNVPALADGRVTEVRVAPGEEIEKGGILGRLEGTVLTRRLKSSAHMLHEPDAWTIDVKPLDDLRAYHTVTKIIIHDTDTGRNYGIDIEEWDRLAKVIHRGRFPQYMVPIRSREQYYWRVS